MEWNDVTPHLTGVAHAATIRPDGRPHVAKVWPAVEGDVVWFATTLPTAKARNLAVDPGISLMWEPMAEAYVTGAAELVTDPAEKQRLWSGVFDYDLAGFFGSADNPDLVFVKVTPAEAVVYTQGGRDRWKADT